MTLPKDPYELTTEQLLQADQEVLKDLELQINNLLGLREHVEARIGAYRLTLEGYRTHRPVAPQNGSSNPFADEAKVVQQLEGLTVLQKLIKLGLMNDRKVLVNDSAKLMHRVNAIGGKWTNIPPRLYAAIAEHPEIFNRSSSGIYELLPGAERHLNKDKNA